MQSPSQPSHDSLHLLALRAVVYAAAALLWTQPIATGIGVFAAMAGAVFGLAAAWRLSESAVRLPAILTSCGVIALIGLASDRIVGGWLWPPRILGATLSIYLIDALTFGLTTLAVATATRVLAVRVRAMAILEASLVVGAVVMLFMGHRDRHFGQPRSLSDWAFLHGYDPVAALVGFGALTLGGMLLLLQRKQDARKTVGVIVSLALLMVFCFLLAWMWPSSMTLARPGGAASEEKPEEDPYPPPPDDRPSTPIAVVLLHAEHEPYGGTWYFRNNACSLYNGKRLVRASSSKLNNDVPIDFPSGAMELPKLPAAVELAKTVPTTVNLIGEISRPICLPDPTELRSRDNPNPQYFRLSYGVTSRVLAAPLDEDGEKTDLLAALAKSRAGNERWSSSAWDHYLESPEDARFRRLAQQILEQEVDEESMPEEYRGSPIVKALAVARWIEKNTVYSTRPGHAGLDDPAAEFLFGNRKGYCVHIAHSMAYLLRTLGVPTRVGTGYAVDAARSGKSSSITITTSDAHAWPELYLQGVGWVIVDASPESIDPNTTLPQQPDQSTMQFLADKARKKPVSQPRPENAAASFAQSLRKLAPWLLAAAVASLYLIKYWRLAAPRFARAASLYRLSYRAALDRLSEVGVRRRFGETREQFAARLQAVVPEFHDLSDAHLHRAVGEGEPGYREQWLLLTDRVSRRINSTAPWHRRMLGRIDPLSWMWVK